MALEKEDKDLASKVNEFLSINRKLVLIILGVVICAVVIIISYFALSEKAASKSVSSVEKIIYDLEDFKFKNKTKSTDTENSSSEKKETEEISSPEVIAEEDKAILDLKLFVGKSGYSGFRANTAIAEIYFSRKNYEEALKFYEAAAKAIGSGYTSGIAYFNVAACADELGNYEKALEFYKKASEVTEFPLVPRAMFNIGRIYEAMNKPDEAVAAYNKLSADYPRNDWALLGKSRVIVLSNDK